jgi:hypothetical protein
MKVEEEYSSFLEELDLARLVSMAYQCVFDRFRGVTYTLSDIFSLCNM